MGDAELRDILDEWVRRWASGRRIHLRRTATGWSADVASASRQREHFIVSPTDEQADLLARTANAERGAWVSVLGRAPRVLHTALRAVTVGQECMMTRRLTPRERPDRVQLGVDGSDAIARVGRDGSWIATGRLAVGGGTAVFDRVEVDPEHRRQGLGRDVMAALEQHARSRGAERGLLIASPSGRLLYESMGWHAVAPLSVFAGPERGEALGGRGVDA